MIGSKHVPPGFAPLLPAFLAPTSKIVRSPVSAPTLHCVRSPPLSLDHSRFRSVLPTWALPLALNFPPPLPISHHQVHYHRDTGGKVRAMMPLDAVKVLHGRSKSRARDGYGSLCWYLVYMVLYIMVYVGQTPAREQFYMKESVVDVILSDDTEAVDKPTGDFAPAFDTTDNAWGWFTNLIQTVYNDPVCGDSTCSPGEWKSVHATRSWLGVKPSTAGSTPTKVRGSDPGCQMDCGDFEHFEEYTLEVSWDGLSGLTPVYEDAGKTDVTLEAASHIAANYQLKTAKEAADGVAETKSEKAIASLAYLDTKEGTFDAAKVLSIELKFTVCVDADGHGTEVCFATNAALTNEAEAQYFTMNLPDGEYTITIEGPSPGYAAFVRAKVTSPPPSCSPPRTPFDIVKILTPAVFEESRHLMFTPFFLPVSISTIPLIFGAR